MAAYMGGGTGSGDTHIPTVMGNRSGGRKMAAMKGGSGAGGTKGATPAAKSAGKAVTKASGAAKKNATKTGTRAVAKGTDASARAGSGRKMGGQRQGGAGFPGNNT